MFILFYQTMMQLMIMTMTSATIPVSFFLISKNMHLSYFVSLRSYVKILYVSLFSGGDQEDSQSSGQCLECV